LFEFLIDRLLFVDWSIGARWRTCVAYDEEMMKHFAVTRM